VLALDAEFALLAALPVVAGSCAWTCDAEAVVDVELAVTPCISTNSGRKLSTLPDRSAARRRRYRRGVGRFAICFLLCVLFKRSEDMVAHAPKPKLSAA
jgi:hypothetical protein